MPAQSTVQQADSKQAGDDSLLRLSSLQPIVRGEAGCSFLGKAAVGEVRCAVYLMRCRCHCSCISLQNSRRVLCCATCGCNAHYFRSRCQPPAWHSPTADHSGHFSWPDHCSRARQCCEHRRRCGCDLGAEGCWAAGASREAVLQGTEFLGAAALQRTAVLSLLRPWAVTRARTANLRWCTCCRWTWATGQTITLLRFEADGWSGGAPLRSRVSCGCRDSSLSDGQVCSAAQQLARQRAC